MRSRRSILLLVGLSVAAVPVPFFAAIDHKLAVMWFAAVSLAVAYAAYRRFIGQELVVALLFALFVTSYQEYAYTSANVYLGRINLFPLIGWTAGLVLLREAYENLRMSNRFVVISAIYIFVLFTLEYVGYHVLGIRIAGDMPSLFGLGIIHGPPIIHWFYVLAGPVYLLVTDYLRVK